MKFSNHSSEIAVKKRTSEDIKIDTDMYLAGGGKITVVPYGISTDPDTRITTTLKANKAESKRNGRTFNKTTSTNL